MLLVLLPPGLLRKRGPIDVFERAMMPFMAEPPVPLDDEGALDHWALLFPIGGEDL
jgi:hypothetical protein